MDVNVIKFATKALKQLDLHFKTSDVVILAAYQSTYNTHLGAAKEMLSVTTYQSTAGNQTTSTTVTKEKCYLISSELNGKIT